MSESRGIAESFMVVVDLANALGFKSINKLPGLWKHDVDEEWEVKCNGHNYEIESVPPYAVAIMNKKYFGVVGIVRPGGGIITGGQEAEDAFIAATKAAIARIKETPEPQQSGGDNGSG